METILFGGNSARSDGVLHGCSGSHWVFSADTDTIEEESPGVTDNPSVQSDTPGSGQPDQTEEHDHGILNQTPATTDSKIISYEIMRLAVEDLPVTNETNENLTDDYTKDLEVSNGIDPLDVTSRVLLPTSGPNGGEERSQVSDGEKNVTGFMSVSVGR